MLLARIVPWLAVVVACSPITSTIVPTGGRVKPDGILISAFDPQTSTEEIVKFTIIRVFCCTTWLSVGYTVIGRIGPVVISYPSI